MGCPAGLPGRRPGPVGSPSLHSTPWGALTLGLPLPGGQCSPALTLPPTQALLRDTSCASSSGPPLGDPRSPRPCWAPVPGGLLPQVPTTTPRVPQVPELTGAQGPGGPRLGTAQPARTPGVRVEGRCSRFASPRLPHVLRPHQHPRRGQGGRGHRLGLPGAEAARLQPGHTPAGGRRAEGSGRRPSPGLGTPRHQLRAPGL